MRTITLDQLDEINLKLAQGIALLTMVKSAHESEDYQHLPLETKLNGLHAILLLFVDAEGLLNEEAVNE